MKALLFTRRSLGVGGFLLFLLPLAAQGPALQAVLQKSRAALRAADYIGCRAYTDSVLLLAQNTSNQATAAARTEAWTLKGRAAYALDRYAQAQTHFEQARVQARAALAPSDRLALEAQVFAAWNLYYAGKVPQGLRLADSVLAWEARVPPCEAMAYAYELKAVHQGERHLLHNSLPHLLKAQAVREGLAAADSLQLYQVYKWFVSVYTTLGESERALEYAHRSLALIERHGGNPLQKSVMYHQMGFNYEYRGEASRSLAYRQQAHEQMLLLPEVSPAAYLQTVSGLALGHASAGSDTLLTDSLYLRVLHLAEECPAFITPIPLCNDLCNYGKYLQARGKPEQARAQYRRAIQLALPLLDSVADAPYTLAYLYNGMLLWHYRAQQPEAAQRCFDTIHTLIRPRLGASNPLLAQMYANYAIVLARQEIYTQAIAIGDTCLQILHATDADSFDTWLDPPTVYAALWNRSEDYLLLFQQSGDSAHLRLAWQGFDRYVQFIDFLRASYRDEEARLGLASDNRVAYEYALSTLFSAYGGQRQSPVLRGKTLEYLTKSGSVELGSAVRQKVFEYITKSSGRALSEAVLRSGAMKAKLPKRWADREKALQASVQDAEKKYWEAKRTASASADLRSAKKADALLKKKQVFYRFLDSLKTAQPQYYKERYQPKVPSLTELQQVLKEEKRGFLAYFLGTEQVFGFWATGDTSVIFQVPADSVAGWAVQLHGYLSQKPPLSPDKRTRLSASYRHIAHQLYSRLFGPIEPLLTRRFTVAPDHTLCYVPFQALLRHDAMNEPDFKNLPYLGKEHVISYAYSAGLMLDMRQKKHSQRPAKEILVMAPFASSARVSLDGRDTLSQLQYSGPEAQAIAKLYGTLPLLDGKANKKILMKTASQYRQLYFATHGEAELDSLGNDARIALAVPGGGRPLRYEWLTVRELYLLSLNTDFVTLSACKTGFGTLKQGEGVLSMARAFAYAGTKSIAYTLWSVDDFSTKELMVAFHQHMKAGQPKDEALWLAQKELLEYAPYYWAGIVLIGQ